MKWVRGVVWALSILTAVLIMLVAASGCAPLDIDRHRGPIPDLQRYTLAEPAADSVAHARPGEPHELDIVIPGRPTIEVDEDEAVVDPEMEATFALPDIDTILWLDGRYQEVQYGLGVELWEWRFRDEWPGVWKVANVGATPNSIFFYSSLRFTAIIEVSAGPVVGYNVDPRNGEAAGWTAGFGLTLIQF